MTIDVVVPEKNRRSYETMHFAPAVREGGFIFVSGVIGSGETPYDEFRDAWEKVGAVLAEAGAGYGDIVDTTLYIVDLQANTRAMAKAKDEFIKEPWPASTWIGISELVVPGARAEIKVVARKGQG